MIISSLFLQFCIFAFGQNAVGRLWAGGVQWPRVCATATAESGAASSGCNEALECVANTTNTAGSKTQSPTKFWRSGLQPRGMGYQPAGIRLVLGSSSKHAARALIM